MKPSYSEIIHKILRRCQSQRTARPSRLTRERLDVSNLKRKGNPSIPSSSSTSKKKRRVMAPDVVKRDKDLINASGSCATAPVVPVVELQKISLPKSTRSSHSKHLQSNPSASGFTNLDKIAIITYLSNDPPTDFVERWTQFAEEVGLSLLLWFIFLTLKMV